MYASPSDNTLWTPVTYYRIALHLNEKAKSKTYCLPTFLTREAKEKQNLKFTFDFPTTLAL